MYQLIKATVKDIPLLKKYKLETIMAYADNIDAYEKKQIKDYINTTILKYINNYQLIMINNQICGCLLIYKYQDGILLDEIYLENDYRNQGIGTDIINKIALNNIVYLWVYKQNNAVNLYKKLGFKIIDETKTRYFMKRSYNEDS